MDIAEREVAPDVAHLWVGREQFAGDRLGRAAVRAFEVPVLDDCARCVGWTADVVSGCVGRFIKIEKLPGVAEQCLPSARPGLQCDEPVQEPT
ncbi:hypothetical protein ADL25_30140 [Streptomyces sp. NRRL F-5122]|nr:hypothetical protein [Streptomyces sp. 3212.3]KUJ36996.1 hypothetical protein ADL25_30140 [Streptomyces sp. NRRL F-5122]